MQDPDLTTFSTVLLVQGLLLHASATTSNFAEKCLRDPAWGLAWIAGFAHMFCPSMILLWLFAVGRLLTTFRNFLEGSPNAVMYVMIVMINLAAGSSQSLLTGSNNPVTESFAAARAVTVLMYLFAAIAKLNTGWDNVQYSGNTLVLMSNLQFVPDFVWGLMGVPNCNSGALIPENDTHSARLNSWMKMVLPVTTCIELILPFALWFSYRWAVVLSLVLHLGIGPCYANWMWSFSVIMFSIVPVLWSPGAVEGVLPFMQFALTTRFAVAASLILMAVVSLLPRGRALVPRLAHYAYLLWSACVFCALAMNGGLPLESSLPMVPTQHHDMVSCAGWLSFALLIVVGISPYLGLRTHCTLTMFSNLKVEAGCSNHYAFPSPPSWPGFLLDIAIVHDSDDPTISGFTFPVRNIHNASYHFQTILSKLQVVPIVYHTAFYRQMVPRDKVGAICYNQWGMGHEMKVLPYAVPYLQLRSLVSQSCAAKRDFYVKYDRVRYVRGGKESDRKEDLLFRAHGGLPTPESDAVLSQKPNLLVRTFCIFRSFAPDGIHYCSA